MNVGHQSPKRDNILGKRKIFKEEVVKDFLVHRFRETNKLKAR